MSNDGNVADHSRTHIRVSITITRVRDGQHPTAQVNGDLPGLFGNLVFDLIGVVGLPRQTSSKANVLMIEELSDAIEYGPPWEGELRVAFEVERGEFKIDVNVPPSPEDPWFPPDANTSNDVKVPEQTMRRSKAGLAAAIEARRAERPSGGIGVLASMKPGGDNGGEGGSPAPATASEPLPTKQRWRDERALRAVIAYPPTRWPTRLSTR